MFVSGRNSSKKKTFEERKPLKNFIICAHTEDKTSVWQIRKGREGTSRIFRN
jgi:hypothetical protein